MSLAVSDVGQACIPAARQVRPNVKLLRALGEARTLGVPQWAVALEAGISPSLLSMIVRGGAPATEANQRAIARALGRDDVDELFPGVHAQERQEQQVQQPRGGPANGR